MIILLNKHVQGIIIGLIAGYICGSMWIGKSQDEMMRQMVAALVIATGVK